MTIGGTIIHINETHNTLIRSGRIAQYRGPLEVAPRPAAISPSGAGASCGILVNECGHPELAALDSFQTPIAGQLPHEPDSTLEYRSSAIRMQPLAAAHSCF